MNNLDSKSFGKIWKTWFSCNLTICLEFIASLFKNLSEFQFNIFVGKTSETFPKLVIAAIQHYCSEIFFGIPKTSPYRNSTFFSRSSSKLFPKYVKPQINIIAPNIFLDLSKFCLSRNSNFCLENILRLFEILWEPQFNNIASKLIWNLYESCLRRFSTFLPRIFSRHLQNWH